MNFLGTEMTNANDRSLIARPLIGYDRMKYAFDVAVLITAGKEHQLAAKIGAAIHEAEENVGDG